MAVNRERGRVERGYRMLDFDGDTLERVAQRVELAIQEYGPTAYLVSVTDRWSEYPTLQVMTKSPETDEEFARRVAREEEAEARAEAAEAAEYARLRKKFNTL